MSWHTPGPWVAHNTGERVFTIKATSVSVNASASEKERTYYQGIASISERGEHPQHGGGIDFETSQANARLIAAAPDLLEALRVLLRDVEAVDAVADYGLELQVGMYQAHKAILKATGRSA